MELHVLSQKLFGFTLHRHVHRHLKDHFIPHEGNQHRPHVLRHRVLFLYSFFLLLMKLAVLGLPILLPYASADSTAITSENIILLSNQSRKDYGLDELTQSAKLEVAAQNKARDMMKNGYFSHYSPDGISPWFWITQAGYQYTVAGENLAIRYNSAEGINDAWLASAAHRANILSPDFKEIGVAVITDNFADEGIVTLVVQMFGTPGKVVSEQASPPQVIAESSAAANKQLPAEKVLAARPAMSDSSLPKPQIKFPLQNSFLNVKIFRIIGSSPLAGDASLYLDGKLIGTVPVEKGQDFELLTPSDIPVANGSHTLYALTSVRDNLGQAKSELTVFKVDTVPPEIYQDKFSLMPHLGEDRIFDATAGVAEDSIRTIVSVGTDSSALIKQSEQIWAGTVKVYTWSNGQSLPVEVYAQDMAGNDNRQRVGLLSSGSVAGVYNFVQGGANKETKQMSLFGGLVTIKDFDKVVRSFYLYFAVFLIAALILNIAVKRHIQHVATIAASSAVVMLAIVFFAF